MRYLFLAIVALLVCSCGSSPTPNRTGDVGDDGSQGSIVEVEHRGRTYVIWHHDGYKSETSCLLTSYDTPAKR